MSNNRFGAILRVDNVNEALPLGLMLLQERGELAESRGLYSMRVPGPVSTVYAQPRRRVLFDPIRDANPFFHLMESLWILSGSNRVDLPKYFLSNIDQFSDDGVVFHGAYGHRLRHAFGFDQIERACEILVSKPDTRQVVMSIWHPAMDLGKSTKDMPCNDMVMLDLVDGKLNMTVCNRSNDAVWGAYGANAVQFSVLQEFIAIMVGAEVGHYVQQSNNYHVYTDNPFWLKFREGQYEHGHVHNLYSMGMVRPYPLATNVDDATMLYYDCIRMATQVEQGETLRSLEYVSTFGRNVIGPAVNAYDMYKSKMHASALAIIQTIPALDWRMAMFDWVERRALRALAKESSK
jgi:thymidylate synthase